MESVLIEQSTCVFLGTQSRFQLSMLIQEATVTELHWSDSGSSNIHVNLVRNLHHCCKTDMSETEAATKATLWTSAVTCLHTSIMFRSKYLWSMHGMRRAYGPDGQLDRGPHPGLMVGTVAIRPSPLPPSLDISHHITWIPLPPWKQPSDESHQTNHRFNDSLKSQTGCRCNRSHQSTF